jgi:uncharacterized protein (DUF2164 family)
MADKAKNGELKARLSRDAEAKMRASIKRFFSEELDEDIGDLKAGVFLEYVLKDLAPTVYNLAIADAQDFFQQRTADLDAACFEREFTYWTAVPKSKGRP